MDKLIGGDISVIRPEPLLPYRKLIKNEAGEIVGAESYEYMTVAEFKERYPELAAKALK